MKCEYYRVWMTVLLTLCLGGCTQLFFFPMREHVRTPSQLELKYEDVYIRASDGAWLHSWFLPAEGEVRGTVLFMHGNAENVSTHIGSVFWLPSRGFNVLLYDYRGYGRSWDVPDLDAIIDDVDDVLDYLFQRQDIDLHRVVVYGQSLGAAVTVTGVARSEHKSRLKAVILESGFSDFQGIAREKMSESWLLWPLQWPLSLTINGRHHPLEAVADLAPVPVLLIHGKEDHIIPWHHSQQLYEAAREPKDLWLFEGAGHINASLSATFRDRLTDYLTTVMTQTPPQP